jgi:S-adenosylmethionine:tRNA ribosyltransferase-isomerase
MWTEDYAYDLPQELIAQRPAARRDASRLLVLDRDTGQVAHHRFSDLPAFLHPQDVLIVNDSRVMPARLRGRRLPHGGRVELLLLQELSQDRWVALGRPSRRIRAGDRLHFGDGHLTACVEEERAEGLRVVWLQAEGAPVRSALERVGEVPLPPYIHERPDDPERYQTVYAREAGSAAAPTAGLHFSEELLQRIRAMGVGVHPLTLHVGLGTFRPVSATRVQDHQMHAEFGILPATTVQAMDAARLAGGRVIAVGTTVVRVLETAARVAPGSAWSGWTDIFIYPSFQFQAVDALITNFHLPRSTLLMLVSAFAGRETTLAAYRVAVAERYRFFSFGDAMLIL